MNAFAETSRQENEKYSDSKEEEIAKLFILDKLNRLLAWTV